MPMDLITILVVLVLTFVGFFAARSKTLSMAGGKSSAMHSLPNYYGYYVAWITAVPAFILWLIWLSVEPSLIKMLVMNSLPADIEQTTGASLEKIWADIVNITRGMDLGSEGGPLREGAAYLSSLRTGSNIGNLVVTVGASLLFLMIGLRTTSPSFRARNTVERFVMTLLIVCSVIAILTTFGIVMSLLFESLRFFGKVSPVEFLFGVQWSPQIAIRADQVGSSGAFGAVPVFTGTMLIMVVAILVAGPVGLLSAVYLSEYANTRIRSFVKPIIEVLAGIPTVVYGYFALLSVAPLVRNSIGDLGMLLEGVDSMTPLIGTIWDVPQQSALAAGAVMGIMIIPFVSSLSDDVINSVPQSLRDGSYALGATQSETVSRVILPAALPGIVGAFLLAISRAIGETMIVVMAAGRAAANFTADSVGGNLAKLSPLEQHTTVTVQIVALLTGDQEFDSAKTLSAFALGLVLFVVTLCLNVIALRIVQKYREQYE